MYLHDVAIQIHNKLVNMGLNTKISFDEFLIQLQMDENTYLFTLQCTLHKPTIFLKHKPNDIRINIFNTSVNPVHNAPRLSVTRPDIQADRA